MQNLFIRLQNYVIFDCCTIPKFSEFLTGVTEHCPSIRTDGVDTAFSFACQHVVSEWSVHFDCVAISVKLVINLSEFTLQFH